MTWKTVHIGAMMTKNRDGSDKSKPSFWTPYDKPLIIPDGTQEHARPVIILPAEDETDTLALSIYRHQIISLYRGKEYILARGTNS